MKFTERNVRVQCYVSGNTIQSLSTHCLSNMVGSHNLGKCRFGSISRVKNNKKEGKEVIGMRLGNHNHKR